MKIFAILVSLFFTIAGVSGQKQTENSQKSRRVEKIINSFWTFNYFQGTGLNKGYELTAFDDSHWPSVSIPHTWNTYETSGELHPFIKSTSETDNSYWWTGWGWYRKHFIVNNEFSDRKVFLQFEGVQKYCKVWLNGKYLGDHKGGYGSFDFDITSLVKTGTDNILVVAVYNRQNDEYRIPPANVSDFDVYGGIYRDVKIVLTDKLFIPMQGSAIHEGGTYVTTPRVSEKEGIVRVQTWVRNDYSDKKSCTLVTSVTDASGNIVQSAKTTVDINQGDIYRFDQIMKPVKNPHLWSNDDPYLYKIQTQVFDGKSLVDEYFSPLGFRWIRWNYGENALYVNGKKTIIHGGNRHQDFPWLGDAVPKWITAMDLADIANNLNYNFLRTAQYPNDRLVYDLTDKYGIVADEEVPNVKNQDFSAEIQSQQLKEMIRRDRNHPSIIFWGLGDETDHAADLKVVSAEDTTRIPVGWKTTGASGKPLTRLNEKNLNVEDLPGNAVHGWYNKDVRNSDISNKDQCGTEESQQKMLVVSRKIGKGNVVTWLYNDHGSGRILGDAPLLHVDYEGYVDMYRNPKYAYFFWQANYSKDPMVFIQPHFWRSLYLGQAKDITLYSNCEKVELLANGVKKGTKIPDQSNFHTVTFQGITVEAGSLTAIGYRDGKSIRQEIVLPGKATKIILTVSADKIVADKGSVVIVRADITDSWGNHVTGADNTIRWSLTGPATLAGPSIYESDIMKNQEPEGTGYSANPVSNVVRSSGVKGIIHLLATSEGLTAGAVDITAETAVPDNSAVTEPPLSDTGREPVARKVVRVKKSDGQGREIGDISSMMSLGKLDRPAYKKAVSEFILGKNPSVDTTQIEFRALKNLLASQLASLDGQMNADDFNIVADSYNNCRLIAGYINFTKLPPLFKEGLRKFYSDEMITSGVEKNPGDEMNWLNWIPSGGTVVIYQPEKSPSGDKSVIYTKNPDLSAIITEVYPQFSKFTSEARERALIFTSKANPYVHKTQENGSGNNGDQSSSAYLAEPGKPILVPLIKFLGE